MQLIEEHIFECAEQLGGAVMRQHQRNLLGRGQQNVGRQEALARAARRRRVAGAGLQLDRQPISAMGVARLRAMSIASAFSGEM